MLETHRTYTAWTRPWNSHAIMKQLYETAAYGTGWGQALGAFV